MLYFNLPILQEDKIHFNLISIDISKENKVIIGENISKKSFSFFVPTFDQMNGYTKILVRFPLEMDIYQNQYLYSILTGEIAFFLNKYNNFKYDFFYNLLNQLNNLYTKIEGKKVNLKYFNPQNILSFPKKIISEYINILNSDLLLEDEIFLENIFDYVYNYYTIIKNLSILFLYQNMSSDVKLTEFLKNKIPIKLIPVISRFINYKFNFNGSENINVMKFIKNSQNEPLEEKDILISKKYFIMKKNMKNNFYLKFFQVNIIDKKKNLIEIDNNQIVDYKDYFWYFFSPEIKFQKDVAFCKYIENLNEISTLEKNNYLELFNLNNGLERLLPILLKQSELYPKINILSKFGIESFKMNNYYINDMNNEKNIIELNINNFNIIDSISLDYIVNSIKNNNDITNILKYFKLYFDKIIYPLKYNRKNLDSNFEKLLYLSLEFIDKIIDNTNSKHFIKSDLVNIIPVKMKNFYINILKFLTQLVKENKINNFLYNNKFYQDTIYQSCLKIILTNKDSLLYEKLLILLGKNSQILDELLVKWEKCFFLKNIADVLEWKNIKSFLPYLNYLLENNKYIFYNGRLNRSIFKTGINENLKQVISCPFRMYQYLTSLDDFIKWTIFLGNKYVGLYDISVSFSSNDIKLLGTLIYYLYNIETQSYTDQYYEKLIALSKKHNKLIIRNGRINLKIKEKLFKLKCNLNLGYLAKHINIQNNSKSSVSLSENTVDLSDNQNEVVVLKTKLKKVTKKYYKYKAKYLKNKNNDNSTISRFK